MRVFKIFVLLLVPLLLQTNWEILDLPTDRGFTEICAIDEQTIFVAGHDGMWYTFDGITWSLDTMGWPSAPWFADDTLGFLYRFEDGDGLGTFRSTDGGRTWTPITDQNGDTLRLGGFSFPKGQNMIGYALLLLDGGRVVKTENGGLNWEVVSPFPDVYSEAEEIIDPRGTSFPSEPDTGYVPADCIEKVPIGGGEYDYIERYSYFKTTDGGQTWVLNEEGLWNDDFNPSYIDFPQNPNIGYMAGTLARGSDFVGYVYKTTDGGATWDTVLKDRPYIVSMCFPESDQVGYVFGDSVAHKTTDGGKTWKEAVITHDSTFYKCHFVNDSVGFVTGHKNMTLCMPYDPGFVLKTTDGLLGIAEDDWVDVQPELVEITAPALFSRELACRYQARESGRIRLTLFDAAGREVQSLGWCEVGCGEGSLSFNGALLPTGVYFIRVEFVSARGNENQTLRAVKVR